MPIIRPRRREWRAQRPREHFVEQLAREIQGELTADPRPIIFEVPMNESGTYHIIVVWDEWEDIPLDERSSIVTEAYAIYDAGHAEEAIAPRITAAIGATVHEANLLDLLPYHVKPTLPLFGQSDRGDFEQKAWQAMREEGAFEFGGGPVLAFPSRQMADEAFHRLAEKMPEGRWHRSNDPWHRRDDRD